MVVYCYVCGLEKDKKGAAATELAEGIYGHPACYITHQVFNILNTGNADVCPSGCWKIDWKASLRDYVKPNVAAKVEEVIAANDIEKLETADGGAHTVVAALQEGNTAFVDFLQR